MPTRATSRSNDLGDFLKSVRSRVTPESVGLRPGSRRRTPGLRREEVAAAADISVTWYTWIEQGRGIACSRATLARIARALRMNETERAHLFALARTGGSSEDAAPPLTTAIAQPIKDIADALAPNPAYVINGRWDVLHFNDACAAVLGAFDSGSASRANVLARLFLDPEWRHRFQEWESTAESAVAQFRAATAPYIDDERTAAFIVSLADASQDFRALWTSRRLAPSPLKDKIFRHSSAGLLTLGYATLRPDAAPADVRLVVYMPRGESMTNVERLLKRRSASSRVAR